jgi:hypothetical protein
MKKLILGGATALLILVGGAFAYRASHASKFRPDCPDCPDCPATMTCPMTGEQVSRDHCPLAQKHAETPACCKQTPARPE